jgi:hypothetical protein
MLLLIFWLAYFCLYLFVPTYICYFPSPFISVASLHVQHVAEAMAEEEANEEVYNLSENEGSVVDEPQIPEVIDEVPDNALTPSQDVPVSVSSTVLAAGPPAAITTAVATNDDAPKKSYASIVSFSIEK